MAIKFTFPRFITRHSYLPILAACLLTFSFIIDNYWTPNSNSTYVESKVAVYVRNAETDFKKIASDTSYTGRLLRGELDEGLVQEMFHKKYFFFIYQRDTPGVPRLRYWNTQAVVPDSSLLQLRGSSGFAQLPNGYYVWNKRDSAGIILMALVPVKWNYIITNEYLQNNFVQDPKIGLEYDILPVKGDGITIYSIYGNSLFQLAEHSGIGNSKNNIVSVWFKILSVILVLIFIHTCASYLAVTKRFLLAVFFFVATIFILRSLSYFVPLPLNFRQFELFDPAVYGSNFILRSLGDLLINAILFVWVVLFVRYQVHEKYIHLRLGKSYKWILLASGSFIIIAATFTGGYIIRSLVADSQISFDVINFFSLTIYSVIGFIVLCCIAIGYYFLCQLILYLLKPFFRKSFIELYPSITVIGLLLLTFNVGPVAGGFAFYSLLWLLGFLFLLNNTYLNLIASRIITSKLVFWLFFFSISITAIIIMENDRKELRNRHHYAEILSTKADPASETLLNTMLTDFRIDFLSSNFSRLKNQKDNQFLKDSLINNNFSRYTNRYDTRVYSYDEKEKPLFNSNNIGYNQLNTILNSQARATGIEGLYYYDESYDLFNYISKKTINDYSGKLLGTIFIVVSPKNIKSETLYPELFSKGHNNAIENSSLYAFALYNKNKLISSHNDYPFPTILPGRYFAGQPYLLVEARNYDELWYNAGADKYVVIVKENRVSIESITLFSYLFCSFLLLTAAFWLINILIRSRLDMVKVNEYWQLTIRNQIHGIIIIISAVSFIVIGVTTILFFIGRYESNNREQLSRAINIMVYQASKAFSEGWRLEDTDSVNSSRRNIEQTVNTISEIHGVDINIYDLDGNLKVSSLPLPYAKGIVSTKMDPVAYFHLHHQKEVQYFQKEHIGKLIFISNYVPVIDADGNAYAYLNIPYFTSESKLKEEISNFLVTIINLNAFIFLIAGIVALFITNRITNSFSVISEMMKKINLGKRNEAIEWYRNDEIGELVIEYNKMLKKLDESAAALAKTEREGAWREMARQVAHEIKNPLTPMKLSMQFLQRSIENNSSNVKELAANVANTLIEQIDHLSKIASEFSQFANIGNANKERMDLNNSLRSIKRLYTGNEKTKFNWKLSKGPVYVYADNTHINRLFTNLIQNALQAVPENEAPEITIEEDISEGSVLIRVTDNGEGIDENIQANIFTPNFTTKTSGTGLGLAMCKRIVEQSNGQIWFETAPHEGTTFYLIFPLATD